MVIVGSKLIAFINKGSAPSSYVKGKGWQCDPYHFQAWVWDRAQLKRSRAPVPEQIIDLDGYLRGTDSRQFGGVTLGRHRNGAPIAYIVERGGDEPRILAFRAYISEGLPSENTVEVVHKGL